ncbi:MAG TPA: energy transducer TonB [Longimicrobium sp.]|nr:energy transducer TonB [Longimicrobium sp.]
MLIRTVVLSAAVLAAAPAAAQSDSRCTAAATQDPRSPGQRSADSARMAPRFHVIRVLRTGMRDAARQAGVEQPEGLVVVEVNARRPERSVVHTHHANVQEDLVRGVVAEHTGLFPTLPARTGVLHFRLDSLSLADGLLDRAIECEPRLADPGQVGAAMEAIVARERPLPAGSDPRANVAVRMLVTREGGVAYAELARSSSSPTLNTAILSTMQTLRFLPAAIGDQPVDAWVELPIRMTVNVAPRERSDPDSRFP